MDVTRIPFADLVPHESPMALLDRVVAFDESTLVADVTIRRDSLFAEADGVPAWVGLEYMAQAVAAHAGLEALQRGELPAIGYLLGTRSYRADVASFPVGARLAVHVESIYAEMGLGAFACRVEADGVLAQGTIKVYQPNADGRNKVDTGKIS